ncbi:MAG: thioredoxin-disulfide reductase [Chloroflexi bacterium]|nr:thioredoxin-disulfide reductase [Chloroflexota bacterium]
MAGAQQPHDIVIIGAGPAGLAAGLYAARARRRTVLLERAVTGGQIALTSTVENYPGVDEADGFELGQAMLRQAEKYGMATAHAEVTGLEQRDGLHIVRTTQGDYTAKAVILTGGADYNRLGVPGEERLTGRGVSYCATCDAAFFKDQVCAVVGGGDAALDEGLFVTRFASKVYIIHRRDELRASKILQERALAEPKIEFVWDTIVTEIEGDDSVERLQLSSVKTEAASTLDVAAVFIFIGLSPNTGYLNAGYLRGLLKMDEGGHIYVSDWMETEIPGLFAAGDVRVNSARQVVTSAGDGATAAIRADHYITDTFKQ